MTLFKGRHRGEQPHGKQFYRDYVKSTFWQLRKRRYFSRYGCKCTICGNTDRVELDHLMHGDYGHERDNDLVALCREHHLKLHSMIDAHGTDFDRERFIEEETATHNAEEGNKEEEPRYEYSPSPLSSVHMILDTMARPIWRIIYGVLRW